MSISEQFEQIILKEKSKEILPFLKGLDSKQKKLISKKIADFEYVWEYNHKTVREQGFTYQSPTTPKGTEAQKRIFTATAFFCKGKTYFEREWSVSRSLNKELLDELLPVYCPTWFADFINRIDKDGWTHTNLDYYELMHLEEKGYLKPSPEILVNKIVQAISYTTKDHKIYYKPERLEEFPNTLIRDIWLIFEYESGVHWTDAYRGYENFKGKNTWQSAFKYLVDAQKLSRIRVLKEALLASNRNFNKISSGWFFGLFCFLEPTVQELLVLENELLAVLSSPHSKVVNGSLNMLKKIQQEPGFKAQTFVDHADLILNSEVKSIVKSTLIILDKIASKQKSLRRSICQIVIQVFSNPDSELQTRAAKLIQRYSPGNNESLKLEIELFDTSILSSAKDIIKHLLPTQRSIDTADLNEENITEDFSFESFPVITSFEDLIFHASQAFDNNDATHFDILIDGIIRFHHKMQGENIGKLEPALQRALKRVIGDFTARIGFLDNMLATFFIEYCDILIKTNLNQSDSLRKLSETYKQKDLNEAYNSNWYSQRITPLANWHTSNSTPAYFLFRRILILILERIRKNTLIPLLSTPTHYPCFINANTLIDRVKKYQDEDVEIDSIDLQIALARVNKRIAPVDLKRLSLIKGEFRNLLDYAFGQSNEITLTEKYRHAWIVGALERNKGIAEELLTENEGKLKEQYFTGSFEWGPTIERFKGRRYDYKQQKNISYESEVTKIEVTNRGRRYITEKSRGLLGIFKSKSSKKYKSIFNSVYADQILKEEWMESMDNDIARFLSLIPGNPGPLLISIIERNLKYSTFFSEVDKRIVINSLVFLASIWQNYNGIPQDFLGICFMCSDKTARSIAGEIWINGVENGQIDQKRVGKAIARMNAFEFTPIKRFTDLAVSLYTISLRHKEQMNALLYACINELSDRPPRGIKKLLELFRETNSNSKLIEDQDLVKKLTSWENEVKSLKSIIRSILK